LNISIELFGQLSPLSLRRQTLELPPEKTAQEVAFVLGLNLEEIGLVTINGVQSEMQDPVPPDCRLCFFPYVSGG
jgi:hypothetical protein